MTAAKNLGEGGGRQRQHRKFIPSRFLGTQNPRHLRAILALMRRPQTREEIDREAGCSNGPALVQELRSLGLEAPCTRIRCLDRDGREVRRGIYSVTARDRTALHRWFVQGGARDVIGV
jgi:hypothetical protein